MYHRVSPEAPLERLSHLQLRDLQIFVHIAETGSLVGAGRRLGVSAPAVTRSLGELEQQLGVRLFTRSTRALAPTEAGIRLLSRARDILGLLDEAQREARGEAEALSGRLRVTTSVTFGRAFVADVLLDFLREQPAISASLVLVDRVVDLVEEGVDVAFRIGELPDSALVARRLGEVRRMLLASPRWLDLHGRPQRPEDLQDHDFIRFTGLMPEPEWRWHDGTRARRQPVRTRLEVNDATTALHAARRGEGITLALSYLVAEELRSGALEPVLAPFWPPPVPVHAVTPHGRMPTARVRAFLDFSAARLRGVLGHPPQ